MIQLRARLADTPHGQGTVPSVAEPIPVAEALAPRKPFVELGSGPVPTLGIRAGSVKPADGRAVIEKYVQFIGCRHAPALVAVDLQVCAINLRLFESIKAR